MEPGFININKENIADEHICCAFSDKKCSEGYAQKKEWLTRESDNGYVFRRLDARAKVFIEYGPAEKGWVPVDAPGYLLVNCFWVSGQYKGKGYAKALLQTALDDAAGQGRSGLVTVAGIPKMHYMSDPKWLVRQGFEVVQTLGSGIALLVLKTKEDAPAPSFKPSVTERIDEKGLVAYYSDRCPFTDLYVNRVLPETAAKRGMTFKSVKIETMEQAQAAPTAATIFTLFKDGRFLTSDLSVSTDSRFDKIVK